MEEIILSVISSTSHSSWILPSDVPGPAQSCELSQARPSWAIGDGLILALAQLKVSKSPSWWPRPWLWPCWFLLESFCKLLFSCWKCMLMNSCLMKCHHKILFWYHQRLPSINNVSESQHAYYEILSVLVIFGSNFALPMVGLTLHHLHLRSTTTWHLPT